MVVKLSVFLHYFSLLIITPQPIHSQKEMLWWLIRVRSMIVSLGLWIKSLSSLKSRAHGLLRHCHIVRCHRPGWQFPSEKGLWEVTPTCYILSIETYTLSYFPPCASCEQIILKFLHAGVVRSETQIELGGEGRTWGSARFTQVLWWGLGPMPQLMILLLSLHLP